MKADGLENTWEHGGPGGGRASLWRRGGAGEGRSGGGERGPTVTGTALLDCL